MVDLNNLQNSGKRTREHHLPYLLHNNGIRVLTFCCWLLDTVKVGAYLQQTTSWSSETPAVGLEHPDFGPRWTSPPHLSLSL